MIIQTMQQVAAKHLPDEIRQLDEADFPDVQRFRDLKSDGILRSPDVVARELWDLASRSDLENGAVLDLRDQDR